MTFVLSVDGLRTVTQLQQRGRYTNKVSSIRNMTDAMNWSMFTADRATHLKVAVLGLSALLLIALIRIFGGAEPRHQYRAGPLLFRNHASPRMAFACACRHNG